MKKEYCDICEKEIDAYNKVTISGAVSNLGEAEAVCRKCFTEIRKIDWKSVVKRAIMEIEKPMMPEVMVIDCETSDC